MTREPFCIGIAGRAVQVTPLFESTRYYCEKYLTDQTPDLCLTVTREDLAREQAALREEARQEGLRPRTFQDPFLERSVIQRKTAQGLLNRDILLLHGSAVALDGQGYLFTAHCGTGKSTHTRLWRQCYPDRTVMINDDKPFLRLDGQQVLICGSPWSGKHGLDTNITVPLAGICILERGQTDRIWPISPEEALPMLEAQAVPGSGALVRELSRRVPLWRMACTRDIRAAQIASGAMAYRRTVRQSVVQQLRVTEL